MAQAEVQNSTLSLDRKDKVFYSINPLHLIKDLCDIFQKYLDNIQVFNQVVQGTPIPQHRKHFLIERSQKSVYYKWCLFFKYLLKFHHLYELGDMLYQGFFNAGLKREYLDLTIKGGNYFLWPQGKGIINPQCELPSPPQ